MKDRVRCGCVEKEYFAVSKRISIFDKNLKMMGQPFLVQTTSESITLTFDRRQVRTEWLLKFMERMRLEMLIQEVDFDEDIEEIGKEMKNSWWERHKHHLIPESEL
ncbi:MAG: hypothetical protein U5L45_03930 [Saprospiraceae bacterium]|nr:hypothetical protein [Saprospiraceae bacterium]